MYKYAKKRRQFTWKKLWLIVMLLLCPHVRRSFIVHIESIAKKSSEYDLRHKKGVETHEIYISRLRKMEQEEGKAIAFFYQRLWVFAMCWYAVASPFARDIYIYIYTDETVIRYTYR